MGAADTNQVLWILYQPLSWFTAAPKLIT